MRTYSVAPDSTARRVVVSIVALFTLFAACTFSEEPTEEQPAGSGSGDEETFTLAIGIEPDTLDPVGQTTTTVSNIVDYVAETLTRINEDGELEPGLAKSWEFSDDGLTLTLELQEGATFHDGEPFNAEAAQFNIERLIDPKVTVPLRGPFVTVESAEAVDENTLEIGLSEPAAYLPSALAATTAAMLSPASVESGDNSYKKVVEPVGTGPYEFDNYSKGDSVTVTKFDDYWGEPSYYGTVDIRIVPEAATRESLVLAGQADMVILPPVPDLEQLENNEDVEVLLAPSNRSIFIALNTNEISDPTVRQALNYAVDKDALIENVLFGAADKLDSPMDESLNGYCETGSYDYDPERARSMLADAGAENLEITLGTPTGRYLQDKEVAQAISGYLEDVGVTTDVETMDWATYVGAITKPPADQQFDAHLLGWAPSFLDAVNQMDQFESNQHPPAGLATSFYKNDEVDQLIAQGDTEPDPDRRRDIYCEAAQLVWEDAPWIFLWSQDFPIVYRAGLEGISHQPVEKFDAIHARPSG
jgi:peptide/nickel transport system substrate-binding protein